MSIGLMSIIGSTPIFGGRPSQSAAVLEAEDRLELAIVAATERVAAAHTLSPLRAAETARNEAWSLSERFGGTASRRDEIKVALDSTPIRAPFGSTLAAQLDARRLLGAAFAALGREIRSTSRIPSAQPRLS